MIDVNNNDYYYRIDDSVDAEVTKKRLTTMSEMGMEEVGYGQFGIKGIMSGLYIEMVWGYTDEEFDDYLAWAKTVKERKS